MAFRIEISEASAADLELIFDFLFQASLDFGEDAERAFEQASSRILEMEQSFDRIANAPFQGTLRPELGEGIRSVTKRRAVIYFDVMEARNIVRILAVFFGGQDHQNQMLARLLRSSEGL